MKFEELLMESTQLQTNKKHVLEEGVMKLKAELDDERALNKVLRAALHGPASSTLPCLSLLLIPPEVQELIKELAIVEAEILHLDQRIQELKLQLHHEQRQTREMQMDMSPMQHFHRHHHHHHHHHRLQQKQQGMRTAREDRGISFRDDLNRQSRSQKYQHLLKDTASSYSSVSLGSATDFLNATSAAFMDELNGLSRIQKNRVPSWFQTKEGPNQISEELIRCLIGIYLDLNHVSENIQGTAVAVRISKHQSPPSTRRPSFSQKANDYTYYQNALNIDPYCVLPDANTAARHVGPYKNFIHITKSSMDVSRFTQCSSPSVEPLGALLEKLSEVDLSFLTYKQKLAFWINIYNACIMHAFLEQGLPPSQDKLLTLMNKALLNVGGIILNALAIEHFILRHPCQPEHGLLDEKETLLRQVYGLGFSEPNVTFALCRGSWSSPALRVYTADDVVNDLGRARVEYLEASVGVSSKKKIMIPQLLQWHMNDFADDMESLLEWIYSQLPRSGSLKGMMMECLNRKAKTSLAKIVEIQPYRHEFCYLLPL